MKNQGPPFIIQLPITIYYSLQPQHFIHFQGLCLAFY